MAKKTIYLADDLAERMGDYPDENWSRIAADAYQARIETLSKTLIGDERMQSMIERLRATKEQASSEAYQAGHKAGAHWAEREATYPELQRLSEADIGQLLAADTGFNTASAGDSLAAIITGSELDRDEARWFLGAVSDDQALLDSPDFVEGFADGALALFEAVCEQV